MHLAARQLPDKPAIDGAKQQLALCGALACALYMVKNPLDFAARKIGIWLKPCVLADIIAHAALRFERIDDARSTAALPHDGVVDGAACFFIPHHGGFALVGDADGGNLAWVYPAACDDLVHHAILHRPNLHCVMLYPPLLRVNLGELALLNLYNILLIIEQNRATACGALV